MDLQIIRVVFANVMLLCIVINVGCSPVDNDAQAKRFEKLFSVSPIMREIELDEPEREHTRFFLLESFGMIIGCYVEKQVVSRSGSFEIGIVLNNESKVLEAVVLNYPYQRGRQVRSEEFTKQFKGKDIQDPLELGNDINTMTGATISCRVMTEGVQSAIEMSRKIYPINHSM